jgi:prepilin-type N-terminal cleavage/methylation domain-containing protein
MRDTGSDHGFTLLEIMVALALVGMVLVTILYTVNYHADLSYENALLTEMYMLAREKLMEMEMKPADSRGRVPDTDFTFINTANAIPDTGIVELKTTISGDGKTVSLREFIVR